MEIYKVKIEENRTYDLTAQRGRGVCTHGTSCLNTGGDSYAFTPDCYGELMHRQQDSQYESSKFD